MTRRQWERDEDRREEEANAKWDQKIADHFAKKQTWEAEIRERAQEQTIQTVLGEAIDNLNNQISQMESNAQIDLEPINRTAKINQAIEAARQNQPSSAEKLKELNKSIETFKTNLAITEMIGDNSGKVLIDIGKEFGQEMREHTKRMELKAKVEMFEEYRKLIENFKFQITVQNEAIENQTRAAATSAGYIEMGDLFVYNQRDVSTMGVVNKYVFYDVNNEVDRLMSEMGFANVWGDQLFSFLEEKDGVEVEAYFYTQKLAAQSVFEKIVGNARNDAERETGRNSKNADVIGLFGMWVGQAPDKDKVNYFAQAAGNSYGNDLQARNWMISDMVGGGFGELGSSALRPSGIALGFYLQLKYFNQEIGKEQSQKGLVQNMYKSKSAYIKQETAQLGKSVVQAAGSALMASTGVGAFVAGAALTYAANSVQINDATGRVSIQSTQQAALSTAISAGTAMLMGGGLGDDGALITSAGAQALLRGGVSALQSGIQYNEKGQVRGYDLNGRQGSAALIRGAFTAASSYLSSDSGQALGANNEFAMLGKSLAGNGMMGEYLIRQTVGKQYSGWDNISLGSELGSIIGSKIGDTIREGYDESRASQNQQNQQNKDALNVLQGAGLLDRLRRFGSGFVDELAALGSGIGSAFGKAVDWIADTAKSVWDRGSNLLWYGTTRSTEELNKDILRKLQNGEELSWDEEGYLSSKMREAFDNMTPDERRNLLIMHQENPENATPVGARQYGDSLLDAAYRLRYAAGRDGRLNSGREGQELFDAIYQDVRELSKDGVFDNMDALDVAEKYNIPIPFIYDDGNAQGANYLKGVDIENAKNDRRQIGATGSWFQGEGGRFRGAWRSLYTGRPTVDPAELERRENFRNLVGTARSHPEGGNGPRGLALLFDNDLLMYGNDDLQERLRSIFIATETRGMPGAEFLEGHLPGLQVGPPRLGEENLLDIYRDGSPTQTGHFLTGLRFALDPDVLEEPLIVDGEVYGTSRSILEERFPEVARLTNEQLALRLAVGHEKSPDPPSIHAVLAGGSPDPRAAIVEQYAQVTEADVAWFNGARLMMASMENPDISAAEPILRQISIDEEWKIADTITINQGNSYADLRLTLLAYDMATRIQSNQIKTRQDAAQYIRRNMVDQRSLR